MAAKRLTPYSLLPTAYTLGRSLGRSLLAGALFALLALSVACSGKKDAPGGSGGGASQRPFDATVIPSDLASATPTPDASATPGASATPEGPVFARPKDDAAITRLEIGSQRVSAPIQVKGVNARNEMENPDGKDNVAWYNFTAKPGLGSNAVFSGHVDWFTGEQGVFWGLRNLKEGDELVIKMSDGLALTYKVVRNETFSADAAPVADIIGPTTHESITLITCDGTFDRSSQDYNNRRIVRAERVG